MRKDLTVSAERRDSRGKNEARRLRQAGKIPAVLYGAHRDTLPVEVDPKEMLRILHSSTGHNTIFNFAVRDRESTPAMIVAWQFDPVQDTLLHVDLKRIDLVKRLRVSIPVAAHGEPKGVKQQGGLLELVAREIEVECLPDEIPEHFTVDVTPLMIGQSLRASEVPLTGSMTLLSPPEAVIAHVVVLRAVVEEAPAEAVEVAEAPAAATAAEPEVIKKGKKEEEAEAAEAKAKKKQDRAG